MNSPPTPYETAAMSQIPHEKPTPLTPQWLQPDGLFSETTIPCSLVGESTFHIADQAFKARSRNVEHEKHQHIIEPVVLFHGNSWNRCSSGVHDQSILAVPDAA